MDTRVTIRTSQRTIRNYVGRASAIAIWTALVLSPWSALAASNANSLDAKVERMTDMIVDMVPLGKLMDDLMAKDPTWPLQEKAKDVSPDQLACVRNELSLAAARKRKLVEVKAYAAADRERFEADYKLMDSGISSVMAKAFSMGVQQARTGEKPNYADAMKGATNNQLLSMTLFMYDPKYKSLRELTGLSDAFSAGQSGGESLGKAYGMKLMVNAMDACHIQLSELLTSQSASAPPSGAVPTAIDFGAVCTNPGESMGRRSKAPSRDATNPLTMPEYPPDARRANESGRVMLRIYVTDKGRVGRAQVSQSSGYSRLDQAALEGARNWQLIPGEVDGKPACLWVTVPVSFNFDDQGLVLTPHE